MAFSLYANLNQALERTRDYIYHFCSTNTANLSYDTTKLPSFLDSLTSRAGGANHVEFYSGTSDDIYGLFLCRGDVDPRNCQTCVTKAREEIIGQCLSNKAAIISYDMCMLRYCDINFFGRKETLPRVFMWNINGNSTLGSPDPENSGM
ncbi:unnamed protein product [Ilex paraguariensis]|uniref:Gnk2-homologous domain-containing protein n=1 Tax=Ilex paraguariensis TaxID=185542 RepID=A0ABC8RE83_9AQUA